MNYQKPGYRLISQSYLPYQPYQSHQPYQPY